MSDVKDIDASMRMSNILVSGAPEREERECGRDNVLRNNS